MKFLKVLGKIFSVIISIFIVLSSFLMIVFVGFSSFIKPSNLKKMINTENVLKIEIDGVSFEDELVGLFEEFDISKSDALKIVNGSNFNELMDDYLDKVVDYYFNDGSIASFDDKKIELVIDEAISMNKTLTSSQKKEFKSEIIKELDNIDIIPSKDEIMKDEVIRDFVNLYSSVSIFYFIGAIILFMFIIFIFTYSLYKPFKYAGISLIVSGFIWCLPYLLSNLYIKLISTDLFIISIFKNLLFNIFISSIIVLFVGILFVVIYALINKRVSKEAV